ncbi:MAG: heavy-metal-associated domain-containing protein [Oscillospiraceae bacterium]|nr:heavy-metal-associated domain-containing protein [Oscillospiraceae bacterium]
MLKTTVNIDGMMCNMCEAHIAETVRKAIPQAKSLKVSHGKGTAVFLTENAPDTETLKDAINATGYTFVSASTEEYTRKGFLGGLFG